MVFLVPKLMFKTLINNLKEKIFLPKRFRVEFSFFKNVSNQVEAVKFIRLRLPTENNLLVLTLR